jgi:uncharacterized membrane protein YeaQ/YmgE (transglycosylase-associated protein family)
VTTGLILLVFVGLLAAYVAGRLRRRLGMAVTLGTWLTVVAAVVLAGLALWALSGHR